MRLSHLGLGPASDRGEKRRTDYFKRVRCLPRLGRVEGKYRPDYDCAGHLLFGLPVYPIFLPGCPGNPFILADDPITRLTRLPQCFSHQLSY